MLAEIEPNTELMVWQGLLGIVCAIVAVTIVPLLQWMSTRMQVFTTTVSASRRLWIDQVRETLAEFLSLATVFATNRFAIAMGRTELSPDHLARVPRLLQLRFKLELLLNPLEPDHAQLIALVDELQQFVSGESFPEDSSAVITDVNARIANITQIAQRTLKREWKRVKAFK